MESGPRIPRTQRLTERSPVVDKLGDVIRHLRPSWPQPRVEARDCGEIDLNDALDTVKHAASILEMMEKTICDVRAKADAQVRQATNDAQSANARAASFEQRALDSEARVDELQERVEAAERRAMEADEWLARFRDTITTLFSATQRRAAA